MINNVGIFCDCMFVNMIEEEWDLVICVYFKGIFVFVYYVVVYWWDWLKVGEFVDVCLINISLVLGIYGNFG